jgi:hypothetical protein
MGPSYVFAASGTVTFVAIIVNFILIDNHFNRGLAHNQGGLARIGRIGAVALTRPPYTIAFGREFGQPVPKY